MQNPQRWPITQNEFDICSALRDLQGRLFGKPRAALSHVILQNCAFTMKIVASFLFRSVIMISKGEIMITSSHKHNQPLSQTAFSSCAPKNANRLPYLNRDSCTWPCVNICNTCNRKVKIKPPRKKKFNITWHEASPPNHVDGKANSNQ